MLLHGLMIPRENMLINFDRPFLRALEKSPTKIKIAFRKRFALFKRNPQNPLLRNHKLTGEYKGIYSINITGDWRALYEIVDNETIVFLLLGTHSQLYK